MLYVFLDFTESGDNGDAGEHKMFEAPGVCNCANSGIKESG